MIVPFVNLYAQNEKVAVRAAGALQAIARDGDFFGLDGGPVAAFEDEWAAYCGASYCVGVGSGLDALRIMLRTLDLEPGDEVIVPAMTFVATWEAVTQAGGTPVPADVNDESLVNPAAVAAAITERTRAILPVHLYGQLADLVPLRSLALLAGCWLFEDAAQSHGLGSPLASRGAAYSFYPTKPLGAWGDAGAIVTNDVNVYNRARSLREHGRAPQSRGHCFEQGYTSRLDAIQARVLSLKLSHLAGWNLQRRDAARYYLAHLPDDGLVLPHTVGHGHVWHLFTVRTGNRAGLAEHLRERGIGTGCHYPVPAHLQPAYEHLGYREGAYPVAERIAAETLSLPLWAGITAAQLEHVAAAVREWLNG